MNNPRIELSSVVSRIDLYDNEFINIFVNGPIYHRIDDLGLAVYDAIGEMYGDLDDAMVQI